MTKPTGPIPASPGLANWLQEHQVALAFSTYRANRLLFLGVNQAGELRLHERLFDRPMGLFDAGASLWMATRTQIWRLDNLLAPGQIHEGGDRLYVPAAAFTTGDVNAHEIVLTAGGEPLFVNTAFSCLARLAPGCSFVPIWQPPFVDALSADDRCHLNGLALQNGEPTWASACGQNGRSAGWRDQRHGGGVVVHVPSCSVVATGLSMPHSPRWHDGRLWLLNSGTGELGWLEGARFWPLCSLPGFARGLAFVGRSNVVVGLSKLRSPQFTGLPLEERLAQEGHAGGCCGLRVIDLASGEILHSLDLPEPIDELFDVVALPGVRQPRALGLQGEDISCVVKLPGHDPLVTVRPKAPSGHPHQAEAPPLFGLPEPQSASRSPRGSSQLPSEQPSEEPLRYQRVFQLTPTTLVPYSSLTFPSLAPGSPGLAALAGELLGVSAMASGTMVGLAIAERLPRGGSRLCSLMVAAEHRRRGIGTRLLSHLQSFLGQEDLLPLQVRYQASALTTAALEPILARLGWSSPSVDFVLIQAVSESLAAVPWAKRYPLKDPHRIFPWGEATRTDLGRARQLGVPAELLPPESMEGLEASVCLGLRHGEELVGWVIAHRTDPLSLRYSSLFVAPAHRQRGQAPALLAEAFRRQHGAGIPRARAAIDARNTAMLRFLRRHLGEHLSGIGESRCSIFALPTTSNG
ncbi:TIGR03032 family protein [Cyanobium sp. Morenito 9A2]|uniref:TIGR03032 family protein n=1 Tax=Cyanobium sp. Morenito 9A2 TaxID=2823718 RepID=UPI0020CCAB11|nr:TIGR03032 family protein [Cyanobium sp. Morenito 9A2]MCP9849483.1 TIGR03032 family protein [Cyanobium sp. Morenito 9A2]